MNNKIELGDTVLITNKHWLRPGQLGVIVDMTNNSRGLKYCVEFKDKWDGGGVDGNKLWLHNDSFKVESRE